MKTILPILALFILLTSCATSRFQKAYEKEAKSLSQQIKEIEPLSEAIDVNPSVNFNLRKPQYIILHHTDQENCQQTYDTFQSKQRGVSAHYVICKDGTVTQMLSDYVRGWHAGKGHWQTINDMNSISLGIELDNNGHEAFSIEQIQSLLELLSALSEKYAIDRNNIIGHSDWAVGRKVDPSTFFPWQQLAQAGFGIWYDERLVTTIFPKEDFNPIRGLKHIGYDISQAEAAIQSFRLHFMSKDTTGPLSPEEIQIIYLLSR